MTKHTLYQSGKKVLAGLNFLEPGWWLFVRIWIALIFFKSGLTKIEDFGTTIALFSEEYQVPLISPVFAAYSATFFELTMPVLVILGLGTRLAALPLLAMTAIINFTYLDHIQHYYWSILLIGLIVHGPGILSADHLIAKAIKQ